jgi:hypothetical protein
MGRITVTFKNGKTKEFADDCVTGGSWSNQIHYAGAFVIIEDAFGNRTSYPADSVESVYKESDRRGF